MTVNEMYECLKSKDGYLPIKSFITWEGKTIWGTKQGVAIADILKILKGYIETGYGDLKISYYQNKPWRESELYQYIQNNLPGRWWHIGEKT